MVPDISALACETFLDTFERLTLRVPLTSFQRLFNVLHREIFRRHFKTVYTTNLSVYVIHYSFYFIQDTSVINDVRISTFGYSTVIKYIRVTRIYPGYV